MASKTSIANRALSKLGQPRVSNVETVDIKSARTINAMWDDVRDAVLQAYPWNFAKKYTNLAPDDTASSWKYTYSYTMPSDFIALQLIKNDPLYDFAGGKIHTDEGAIIYIQYTAKITNTGEYSPMFNEALASRLAYEGCEEITQSNTKKDSLLREYDMLIVDAYRQDAEENPIYDLPDDDWIIART